ncbi:hypothetical protein BJX64DRAFT_294340 [Aspergillus heterothallicus]
MSSPPLPANSAPAPEVRAYITQTLITTHDVTPEIAEKHAGKWDIGRGYELKQASLRHLQRVFGDNVGLALYHAVREERFAPREKTAREVWSLVAADITGLLLAVVFMLRFMPQVLGLRDRRDPIMWAANPIWWFSFAGCAANAAYQGRLQDTKSGLLLVGGLMVFLVGIQLVVLNYA